jgi:hypothetical protein
MQSALTYLNFGFLKTLPGESSKWKHTYTASDVLHLNRDGCSSNKIARTTL